MNLSQRVAVTFRYSWKRLACCLLINMELLLIMLLHTLCHELHRLYLP
jgi:hypothetical protein